MLFLIVVISLPAVWSLFQNGYFESDDGEWMVIRFSAFHQSLRDGQIPVRVLGRLNYGYGYPVANFLYPGFMYIAEPIYLFTSNLVNTIKILITLSMVGSAVFTYLWLSKLFDKFSAYIGALYYLYTPYHLFDLYSRGSVGELLAFSIIPFILWQIERSSFFWSSLGLGLLIVSHNTLAFIFLHFIILYIILREQNKNLKDIVIKYGGILIAGLGISAFFWIPSVVELSNTRFSDTVVSNYKNYFALFPLIGVSSLMIINISSLFFALNLEGDRVKKILHRVSHSDRLNGFVLSFGRFAKNIILFKSREVNNHLFLLFIIVAVFSVFMSISMSERLWQVLPVSIVQFPYRFLSLLIVTTAYLSAYSLFMLSGTKKIILSVILAGLVFYSSFIFIRPSVIINKPEGFYSTNEGTTTVQDEYMPKWVKVKPTTHFENKVEIIGDNGDISGLFYNNQRVSFEYTGSKRAIVRINTIYYPGWNVFINNQRYAIDYSNAKGVMDIEVKKGKNKVLLTFTETPFRYFTDILSLFSIICLFYFTFYRKNSST